MSNMTNFTVHYRVFDDGGDGFKDGAMLVQAKNPQHARKQLQDRTEDDFGSGSKVHIRKVKVCR